MTNDFCYPVESEYGPEGTPANDTTSSDETGQITVLRSSSVPEVRNSTHAAARAKPYSVPGIVIPQGAECDSVSVISVDVPQVVTEENGSVSSSVANDTVSTNSSDFLSRSNIKFVSYNVDGLSHDKFESLGAKLLQNYDVILLQETFADGLNQYKLQGFDSYASIRKRGVGARRNSGGLLVLIRQTFSKFFKPLHSSSKDILWFRVSQLLQANIILGVGYCSPIHSRATEDHSFYFHLEENLYSHINIYPDDRVVLLGDFNARTGGLADIIESETESSCVYLCDRGSDLIQGNTAIPERVNSDKEVNAYGKNLINICMEFGLCLLNGRSGHDNNLGTFTCITYNGCSVVDYALISYELLDGVKHFEVLPFSDFSVHFPLSFEMEAQTCSGIIQKQDQFFSNLDQRSKYVWKDENEELFLLELSTKSPTLDVLNPVSKEDIDSSLNQFYDTMDKCALGMKHTSKPYSKQTSKPLQANAPFFDSECVNSKSKLNRAHRDLNEVLRQNHLAGGLDPLVDFYVSKYKVAKADHKELVKVKKQNFLSERECLAESLSTNSKDFWEYYKNNRNTSRVHNQAIKIQPHQWIQHVENLFARQEVQELDEVNIEPKNTDILDAAIAENEIKEQIEKLKNKKSPGPDGLCSQILKKGKHLLLYFLLTIFNAILTIGYYPIAWSEALVFMLFKKGDSSDVNNYRSISLLNILGKIFASILQKRLYKWCSLNNVLSENQFGFRPGRSTIDCIFVHNTLVQHHLAKKRRKLYVCYIDFSKAFDCVSWDILWLKLEGLGISRDSKFLKVLKSMYKEISCRVITPWGLTQKIQLFRGVRQGCILSPLLFALFIDDVKKWLSGEGLHEFYFENDCPLTHLLFADDLALFSQSVVGLQRMIDKLASYCGKFNMKINTDKTKIVVYRKGGKLARKEAWYLNNSKIEVVSKFRYLGITLSSSGFWTAAQAELACRATKGLFCIKNFTFNSKIQNVKILLKLFDSCIGPILNYGAEIWGFHEGKDIDRVCDNFYKCIVKLPKNCSNIAARGELGRVRAYVGRYSRIIKYWLKLINNSPHFPLLLQKAYQLQLKLDNEGKNVWVSDVRSLLCALGFSYEWEMQQVGNHKTFLEEVKNRIIYLEKTQFCASIISSPRLQFYGHMKLELAMANYWNCNLPFCMKAQFCRLICSGHNLEIELGRRLNIPRSERSCLLCGSNEVGDEIHFILKCSALQNLRVKYIPAVYWAAPSWNSALSLVINPENTENLLRFCFYAFKHRDNNLNLYR